MNYILGKSGFNILKEYSLKLPRPELRQAKRKAVVRVRRNLRQVSIEAHKRWRMRMNGSVGAEQF